MTTFYWYPGIDELTSTISRTLEVNPAKGKEEISFNWAKLKGKKDHTY
jgi:hypothetical protein